MEGSSHSLLQGIVLMMTPFFWDKTLYQLVGGPNVLKQCSGFKSLGSNYPTTQHCTTEEQSPQLHHCKTLITILICWTHRGKPQKPSVRTASFLPEI